MRQLLKTTFTFAIACLLTAGMALGQQTNDAVVNQDGGNNSATLEQVFDGSEGINEAFVDQDGTGNDVLEYGQRGSGNLLNIVQDGNDNLVEPYPEQGDPNAKSFNGETQISQTGNENTVWDADQEGYNNYSDINQRTDENFVDIEAQVNPGESGTVGNSVTITQDVGDGNLVGTQDGNKGFFQYGQDNSATLTQNGSGNKIGTKSVSNAPYGANLGISGQAGGTAGEQSFAQLGQGNRATMTQTGSGNVVEYALQDSRESASGNIIDSEQIGTMNTARFSQVGGNNTANLTQMNMGNDASIFQSGTGNVATVTQQ